MLKSMGASTLSAAFLQVKVIYYTKGTVQLGVTKMDTNRWSHYNLHLSKCCALPCFSCYKLIYTFEQLVYSLLHFS